MLPFDNKPWAKHLATTVIVFTVIGLIAAGFYLNHIRQLHISECVAIFLLFVTIVPPNLAVLYKKPAAAAGTPYGSNRDGRHITAH